MSIRTERLASELQKDLGEILQRNYQPSGTFVTVASVRVTDDLSIAKVYISVFSPQGDTERVYKLIDDHQDEIRYELASRIKHQVRRIPELIFFEDDTSAYVDRMETIFARLRSDRKEEKTDGDVSSEK